MQRTQKITFISKKKICFSLDSSLRVYINFVLASIKSYDYE